MHTYTYVHANHCGGRASAGIRGAVAKNSLLLHAGSAVLSMPGGLATEALLPLQCLSRRKDI